MSEFGCFDDDSEWLVSGENDDLLDKHEDHLLAGIIPFPIGKQAKIVLVVPFLPSSIISLS